MTLSNDLDREIATFLLDGPIELPDRSFDAVRSEIERTRQRGSFVRWPGPAMSDLGRLLTMAAVVLVAFVGLTLLESRANLGTQSTPAPCSTPSAEPSVEPSGEASPIPAQSAPESSEPSSAASPEPAPHGSAEPCATPIPTAASTPAPVPSSTPPPTPPPWASGPLVLEGDLATPGTYLLAPGFPVVATIDVPEGWTNCTMNPLEQGICNGPAGVGLTVVENVVADPCVDLGMDPPVGPTVDDLVAAIRGLKGFESTDPVDITIDGYLGSELIVTAPPNPICDLYTWSTIARTNVVGAGEVNRLRIVDVGGTRVVVAAAWHPGQQDTVPEILGVLDSVRFPSAPARSPAATAPSTQGHQTLDDPLRLPGRAWLAPGFPVAATVDVPAGWGSCINTPLEQAVCGTAEGGELALMYVENVVADPCGDVGISPPIGPTVDDLVMAIRSLEGFVSTDPVDVTVDGHSGKEFTLTAPTAPTCDLRTWFNGLRTNRVGAGEVNRIRIVDVDGTRILLSAARGPEEAAAAPELLAVLESVEFP